MNIQRYLHLTDGVGALKKVAEQGLGWPSDPNACAFEMLWLRISGKTGMAAPVFLNL